MDKLENNQFSLKKSIASGWRMFKKSPITWFFIVFILLIIGGITSQSLMGRFIAAFIFPLLLGGAYFGAHNNSLGKGITIECLFSMFKLPQQRKQLAIVGGVGFLVACLNAGLLFISAPNGISTHSDSFITSIISSFWSMILLFSIPLISINNITALSALKTSLSTVLSHIFSLTLFYFLLAILIVISAIPLGLGLLVSIPVAFCSSYFVFRTVYFGEHLMTEDTQTLETKPTNAPTRIMSTELEQITNDNQADPLTQNGDDLPKGIIINYHNDYIHLIHQWYTPFLIISLVITAMMFNAFFISNNLFDTLINDERLALKAFSFLFLCLGLFSIYAVFAYWFNKTHIYVSQNTIQIKIAPLPWLGNKRLDAKQIKQLFVKTIRKGKAINYHIMGITKDGVKFNLLKNFRNQRHALLIEKKIEEYLDIVDEY